MKELFFLQKQYLRDEVKNKENNDFDCSDWESECVKDIPQQTNGYVQLQIIDLAIVGRL